MSLLPHLPNNFYWAPASNQLPITGTNLWNNFANPMAVANSAIFYQQYFETSYKTFQRSNNFQGFIEEDKFQITLDVKDFKLDEITVKVGEDSNIVIVEAKHEEIPDQYGLICRYFTQKYLLPKNSDIDRLQCNLSFDGVLTIKVPTTVDQNEQRNIPITQNENSAVSVENEKTEDA